MFFATLQLEKLITTSRSFSTVNSPSITFIMHLTVSDAVTRVLYKKVFLKISLNSQENTCARVSFSIQLQASGPQLYTKRDFGIGVFLWVLRNFKNIFFTEHLWNTVFAVWQTKIRVCLGVYFYAKIKIIHW